MPRTRIWNFCARGLLAALGIASSPAFAQLPARNESIGNEVQLALDRGTEFVLARQNPDSTWGSGAARWWPTSLILLGLSGAEKADGSPRDRSRERGLAALRSLVSSPKLELRTVEFAVACLALDRAQASEDEELLRKSATRLMSRQIRSGGDAIGGFAAMMRGDLHATRLARLEDLPFILLFLRKSELLPGKEKEAEACLARTMPFVRGCADPANPGAYLSQPPHFAADSKQATSAGVTAAGIFSLLQERSSSSQKTEIQTALKSLADRYEKKIPANSLDELLLAMTLDTAHVSRLDLLGGGKSDWARDLAEKAINAQNADGSWQADLDAVPAQGSITSTACRLLMLQIIRRSL